MVDVGADGRKGLGDFVIADAKDADMSFGLSAAGPPDGAPGGELGPGRYQTGSATSTPCRRSPRPERRLALAGVDTGVALGVSPLPGEIDGLCDD